LLSFYLLATLPCYACGKLPVYVDNKRFNQGNVAGRVLYARGLIASVTGRSVLENTCACKMLPCTRSANEY
jgi:hypothetical protein